MKHAPNLPFPELCDRFRLRQEYRGGEGWSGAVEFPDGSPAVVKVLEAGAALGEASLLSSLDHPRVPQVLEIGELTDGRPYLVRQYLEGRALTHDEVATLDEVRVLAIQLLEVLAYIHLRGVLHLDIKPANILSAAGSEGTVYHLLDFGLGTRTSGSSAGGTPFFAAPERVLGLPADARSDLFSLGVVLWSLLRPAGGPLPVRRHASQFPRVDFLTAVGATLDGFPLEFRRFLQRLLAHAPDDRYPDAEEALAAIAGNNGRPSVSILRPDPIAMHGASAARTAHELEPGENLCIRGEDHEVRAALALHTASALAALGTFTIQTDPDQVTIRRGDAATREFVIPSLCESELATHLANCLLLTPDAAADAARHLLATSPSLHATDATLRSLVDSGAILPHGTRWIWPDAVAGRIKATPPVPPPRDPQMVRRAAAAGRVEQAFAAYRHVVAQLSAVDDRAWRAALAEGLLLAGEPARCLPLVADLPIHHARARLDLGQSTAAAALLHSVADRTAEELCVEEHVRQRLIATVDHVSGNGEAALNRLPDDPARLPDRILRSQVLLGLGRAQEAWHALEFLDAADSDRENDGESFSQPFLRAAALTSRAECRRALGDLEEAFHDYEQAQGILLSLGHVRHSATASTNLGVIAKDLRRFDEAVEFQRRARAMYDHVGDERGIAFVEANHGILNVAMGDPATGLRRLRTAFERFDTLGARQQHPHLWIHMAEAHAALGETEDARRCLAESGPPEVGPLASLAEAVAARLTPADPSPDPSPDDKTVMVLNPVSAGVPKEVFRTFLAVNRRLAGEADLGQAMTYLLDAAVTLTGGRTGYLLVLRDDGLRQEFRCGETSEGTEAFSRSMVNRAIQQRRTQTGEDALLDRELVEMPSVQNLRRRSAICAPFTSAAGNQGALYVEHGTRAGVFGDSEREHLEILADQAAIAVDRMRNEEALTAELELSRHDLTLARRSAPSSSVTMLGQSPPMKALRKQIEKVAASDLAVLIRGETGSGKELVARALHQQSHRGRGPFVAENCSAIPENLMESEFFGHVKGAFTGADNDRPGLLELANGGTLFLDEIGDMPMALQVKLLRALQESAVRRVGGTASIPIDIRLVSATHKDLRRMIEEDTFREDLFFRIAAVDVLVPPLRERGKDIPLLADSFLDALNAQHRRQVRLAAAARTELQGYDWPGNVRELHHVISRVFILAENAEIESLQLPDRAGSGPGSAGPHDEWPAITLAEAEARTIRAALRVTGGDKTKAARLLGISRTSIYEKLKRMQSAEEA